MNGIKMPWTITADVASQSAKSQIAWLRYLWHISCHLPLFIPDYLKIEAASDTSEKIPSQIYCIYHLNGLGVKRRRHRKGLAP